MARDTINTVCVILYSVNFVRLASISLDVAGVLLRVISASWVPGLITELPQPLLLSRSLNKHWRIWLPAFSLLPTLTALSFGPRLI